MLTAFLATALLALTGLVACASDEEYDPNEESKSPSEHYLIGFAYADGPIRGARLRVYSIDGELLADEPRATEAEGTFYVEEPDLPAHYTVVATGGTHEGKPFRGELRAEVRDDEGAVIHLNPVSTITSHHLEQNPDASHDEATDEVHEHLAIPTALETHDLRLHDRHFHGDTFLARAHRSGGVSAHAKELAEDAAGDGPPNAFPRRASNQAELAATVAQFAGEKLLKLLAAKAAENNPESGAVGTILASIQGEDLGSELDKRFAVVNAKLEQIQKDLADVKDSLSQIQEQLDKQELHGILGGLPLDQIDYASERLVYLTKRGISEKARKNVAKTLVTYIEANLQDAPRKFDRAFTGSGAQKRKPLMRAYREVARAKVPTDPILTAADNRGMFTVYEYYDAYLVRALNAIVEWKRATDAADEAKDDVDEVTKERKQHVQTLPSKMPKGGAVDTRTNLYWESSECEPFSKINGAVAARNQLARNGFKNWRLAKSAELFELLKADEKKPTSNRNLVANPSSWLKAHGFDDFGSECGTVDELRAGGQLRQPFIVSGDYTQDLRKQRMCEIITYPGDPPLVKVILARGGYGCAAVGSKPGRGLFVRGMEKGESYW